MNEDRHVINKFIYTKEALEKEVYKYISNIIFILYYL